MPHVNVKLWPGKSELQKQRLADEITKDVMKVLNYGEESVSLAIEEIPAAEWAEKVYRTDIVANSKKLYEKPGYKMCGERPSTQISIYQRGVCFPEPANEQTTPQLGPITSPLS